MNKLLKSFNNIRHRKQWFLLTILFVVSLAPFKAYSHALNENYIWLNVESDHLLGRFEVNVDDLEKYLDIDVDSLASDRLSGVRQAASEIQTYVEENFQLVSMGQQLPLIWIEPTVFEENPDYLQYWFKTDSVPADDKVTVQNTLFLTEDLKNYSPRHRSVLVIEYNKKTGKEFGLENSALVFKSDRNSADLDLNNPGSVLSWKDFLWQGVLHIIHGYDHVLFIVVLLLTTVLRSDNGAWVPLTHFKPAFFNTLKIVTLFTIAHSITLSLAALQLVSFNVAVIESVIALSIIAIGLNNLKPVMNTHTWLLVFLFGLFHGLGFASVMGDLQFRTALLERILIMFNLGVELGQLAIVIVVFPILFLLRNAASYNRFVMAPVSVAAICVAGFWFTQRIGVIG